MAKNIFTLCGTDDDRNICNISSIGGQAIIRGSKKTFVLTKMAISFLSGATIAMLPLLFDFALTSSTLPAIIPKVSLGLSPIGTEALMGELFYEHPLVYTLIYIGINGLWKNNN